MHNGTVIVQFHSISLSIFFERLNLAGIRDCGRPAPRTGEIRIINWTDKMDPTPNFGVTMISEVPSNPLDGNI